jgi:hypothetical protein
LISAGQKSNKILAYAKAATDHEMGAVLTSAEDVRLPQGFFGLTGAASV